MFYIYQINKPPPLRVFDYVLRTSPSEEGEDPLWSADDCRDFHPDAVSALLKITGRAVSGRGFLKITSESYEKFVLWCTFNGKDYKLM